MKKIFFILVMVAALGFAVNANATIFGGDDVTNNYVTNEGGEGGDGGTGVGIGIGLGGNAKIEKGAIKNTNKNSNFNLNSNTNKQSQGQLQGQGQAQGQGQKQSANNEGVDQTVIVNGDVYEAAPNHIQGPELIKADAKFADGKSFKFRTMGSFWTTHSGVSKAAAYNLAIDADDAKVDRGLAYKYPSTEYIQKGVPVKGVDMGSLYVYPDGSRVTVNGLEGKGLEMAMKYGATHAVIIYDSGDAADGSAWNVGIGGGGSFVLDAAGKMMAAPNGGLGYGEAHATNSLLPAMVIRCFRVEQ